MAGKATTLQICFRFFAWVAFLVGLEACSTTKTVPPGEQLYTGSKVELQHPDSVKVKDLKQELQSLLAPDPNSRILGLPIRLYLYNLFETERDSGGLGNWLQERLGEAPVLYDNRITQTVRRLLANRAYNRGFFDTYVDVELDTGNQKTAVAYEVHLKTPYRISQYQIEIEHDRLSQALSDLPPSRLVTVGQAYNLDLLQQERARIGMWLLQKGYFYFNENYLKFIADTLQGDRSVGLRLLLKEEAPQEDLRPFYIDSITVFPDYQVNQNIQYQQFKQNNLYFRYRELNIRPETLIDAIQLRPGERYDLDEHRRTQERLLSLAIYQFVNVRFDRQEGADSLLKVDILLTPRLPNTVEGSAGLVHRSTRFLGPELMIGYTNRNLLGGAEVLEATARGNFNFPLSEEAGPYYEELEARARINRPGLLIPFVPDPLENRLTGAFTHLEIQFSRERARYPLKPDTISIGQVIGILDELNYPELAEQLRQDSTLAPFAGVNEFRLAFGYQWRWRRWVSHQFSPLVFRLQSGTFRDPQQEVLLLVGAVLTDRVETYLNLQNMFIYQPDYIYLYDSRQRRLKRNNLFYRGRAAFAGNVVLGDKRPDLLGEDNLESQFIQLENDGRFFHISRQQHTLATRLILNFSVPLSNEFILPFFDFYSVGGPNSIRAFQTRELGPGTLPPDLDRLSLFRGKGDIQVESSVEYRYRLNALFELAFFVDAGNVWLFRPQGNDDRGQFRFKDFYRELAVGTGMGLRINLSGLLLRLDLGIPVRKPWLPESERWVIDDVDFGDPSWRKENLALNLAFGYPF